MTASSTRKLSITALLCALLAGCTMAFTYNHLDWFIPWYVDDYVDLSRQQRHLLQDQLGPLLEWHREEELERYLELLNRVEAELAGEVTGAQVRGWAEEVINAVDRVEQNMLPVALEFGATLSDEQLEEFMDSVWKEHREYEEEYLARTDQEYVDEHKENLEEFLERWTGRLNDEQEAILQDAAGALRRFDTTWLEDHQKWLETLGPLLSREPGWQENIKEAYANRTNRRTAEYQELFEHNMDVVSQAFAEILNQLTEKQQKHLDKEIEDLRSLILRLIDHQKTAGGPNASLLAT